MANLPRELNDFFRFFFRTPRSKKAIVFYAQHKSDSPYFEGIINELFYHNRSIAYITSDVYDPVLEKSSPLFTPFYSNTLAPYLMAFLNAKICVMTVPDLDQLTIRRSANPVHYVYVMHTLVSTHRTYNPNALDAYDTIFCGGPHQVAEIRKREETAGLTPKKLVETGYYRLERVYEAYRNYQIRLPQKEKITILIAPSWGENNVLEAHGTYLIEILLKNNYEVIVRPHPETVRRSRHLIESFRQRFGGNPFFTLETSIAGDESLLRADALICDMSGVALEYAFGTERPVLFLDVPLKVINPNFRELGIEPFELTIRSQIGKIISPEKIADIDGEIKNFIAQKDQWRDRLCTLREKHVFSFGRSSKIGVEYIMGLLK